MTDVQQFKHDPYVLSLGMSFVNVGSGLWVLCATALCMPVSTTHAVVGAVIGIGMAAWGPGAVVWTNGPLGGVLGVVLSWFLSPVISGCLAALFYMTTKMLILGLPDEEALAKGLKLMPLYFFFVFGTIWGFMMMKGIPALKSTPYSVSVPITFGLAIFHCIHGAVCVVPWLRRTIQDKENLPWYTALCAPAFGVGSYGYYESETDKGKLEEGKPNVISIDNVSGSGFGSKVGPEDVSGMDTGSKIGKMIAPGLYMDIGARRDEDAAMHAAAFDTPPMTDEMFKFLQLTSCCFFSISHGANDVANAVAPFGTVWAIYSTGKVEKKAPVPVWLLVYGGLALDAGLLTMGHHIMAALGNRITLQSPSRGFCIELGAMFCVMVASRVGIPVSTTHCITGATVAIGLCNGNMSAVNWKLLAVIFFGWIITCPCAGILTGLSLWAVAASPHASPQTGMFGVAAGDNLWTNYTTFIWNNRTAIAELYHFDKYAKATDPVCTEVFNKTTEASLGLWNCNGGDKYEPAKYWYPSGPQSK